MFKEFREFAIKGNVIDLAVGVVIGAAFTKIVDSFVTDVLTPPLSLVIARVNMANLFVALDGKHYASLEAAQTAKAPILAFGLFINNVISFLLVAFAVFLLVKGINRVRRELEALEIEALKAELKAPPPPDPAARQIEQNERIIALLEKLASKE